MITILVNKTINIAQGNFKLQLLRRNEILSRRKETSEYQNHKIVVCIIADLMITILSNIAQGNFQALNYQGGMKYNPVGMKFYLEGKKS